MEDQELEAAEEELKDGFETEETQEKQDVSDEQQPEKEPEEEPEEPELTPEQHQRIIDQAISDGKVVDYEKRFKPIYGALKQTERDLEAQKNLATGTQIQQRATEVAERTKPKVDDFDDYDQFTEALTDWKLDQRDAVRSQEKVEADQKDRQQWWEEKISKAKLKDPEFDEKTYIPEGLVDLVDGSEKIIELAYYFGDHPEEARNLLTMNSTQAARKIGRLEAVLSMPAQKTRTKAPKPTGSADGTAPIGKSLEALTGDDDYEAFKAARKAGVKQ